MNWENQTWQTMLQDLRDLQLTQEEIGSKVGVGRSYICKLLKGSVTPSKGTYAAIERVHTANKRAINKARKQV